MQFVVILLTLVKYESTKTYLKTAPQPPQFSHALLLLVSCRIFDITSCLSPCESRLDTNIRTDSCLPRNEDISAEAKTNVHYLANSAPNRDKSNSSKSRPGFSVTISTSYRGHRNGIDAPPSTRVSSSCLTNIHDHLLEQTDAQLSSATLDSPSRCLAQAQIDLARQDRRG